MDELSMSHVSYNSNELVKVNFSGVYSVCSTEVYKNWFERYYDLRIYSVVYNNFSNAHGYSGYFYIDPNDYLILKRYLNAKGKFCLYHNP